MNDRVNYLMKVLRKILAGILCFGLFLQVIPVHSPVSAQQPNPIDWQTSAKGLGINQNEEKSTAGLSLMVQAGAWPALSTHGGVKDVGNGAMDGPTGIELGEVRVPATTAVFSQQRPDWSHNELTYNLGSGGQLKVVASRLSPAVLVQSASSTIQLFTGDLPRNSFDGSNVTSLDPGPVFPKFTAYRAGGIAQVHALSGTNLPLQMDQHWLLVWYGENSQFTDTKTPLSYAGSQWHTATLPHRRAYQADIPLLLVFQNLPQSIKHAASGGLEITFSGPAGYFGVLPLLGRDHLRTSQTAAWAQGLPAGILQKAQFWSARLCNYPSTVSESYAYDPASDTVTVTENFNYTTLCAGGTIFAPVPPMLALSKDTLPVQFSGPLVDGEIDTEFGPTLGIENVSSYTWQISGLGKYIDGQRIFADNAQPAQELSQALDAQVQALVSAGHLAPWIFSDSVPRHNNRGDIYWLNPAQVLTILAEVSDALPAASKGQLVQYLKSERSAYPPEDVSNLPLDTGTQRAYFALSGQSYGDRWVETRPELFLQRVPLYNYYALERYYELTNDTLPSGTWQKALSTLDQGAREQDWASFYWFEGFDDRPVAVVNANRYFAGLVGFVRLAGRAGDAQAEALGRALFAKAAVLRLGMAKYPAYLYAAGLVELPPEPDWMVTYTEGKYNGFLFTYHWTGAQDDARQFLTLNQFGIALNESVSDLGGGYLIAFKDLTPHLARFLRQYALEESSLYIQRVETFLPHWYMAFAEGTLGQEHNLSYPIDSYQTFLAKAWIEGASAQELSAYTDIPWLQFGDLFYMHKIAEAIKTSRGYSWNN
jgi:hypothetical protein